MAVGHQTGGWGDGTDGGRRGARLNPGTYQLRRDASGHLPHSKPPVIFKRGPWKVLTEGDNACEAVMWGDPEDQTHH